MSNRTRTEQERLRELISQAVSKGIIIPTDVIDFILDNGWEYSDPTRMTVIKILGDFGVKFVAGYWVKK